MKQNIWNYPDKEKGYMTLAYKGKKNIIYLRKSRRGKIFLHAGTYSAGYMNQLLDERMIKYLFVDDIPNYRYITKSMFNKNANCRNDYYIEMHINENY